MSWAAESLPCVRISAATTATGGPISLPELKSRGYAARLVIGSLAGSSTLGLLIPPSIVMIVYGVAAQVSVNRLFTAGLVPSWMLMALFSGYIAIWSKLNPMAFKRTNCGFLWANACAACGCCCQRSV
ncbi:TRAP transporter large permease subunit [Sulfitobacter sp.]|uniref:TRAP transporter large permease subunit n=1 Tax=Sulfitobacter sp. TaxID=1903071 RepID=UPI003002ED09